VAVVLSARAAVVICAFVIAAAGCARMTGTAAPASDGASASPGSSNWTERDRAQCDARGGGVWVSSADLCIRGGGGN
jgi:hypothetical protein